MFTVKKATLDDLNKVAPLYKEYLTFYHVDYSEKNQQKYLEERLSNNESVIYYIVDKDDNYVGFTQL